MAARRALILAAFFGACAKAPSRPAASGDTVRVHYTLKAADSFVESTETAGAKTAVLGRGEILLGLEKALIGMRPGEERSLNIPPEDAFGLKASTGAAWSGRVISARVKLVEIVVR